MEGSSTKQFDMDPNGDIVLLLCSDHGNASIKASSNSLSLASPVFKAMLCPGSRFLEGAELAKAGPGEVRVKLDDNLGAMVTILRVLHYQNKRVPRQILFEDLCEIAIVADKYNLAESILSWYEIWANPHREYAETAGYERWLFISWVFGDDGVFNRVSRQLISHGKLNSDGIFVMDSGVEFSEGVPDSIIETISQRSKDLIGRVISEAENEINKYCKCSLEGINMRQRPSKRSECDSISVGALLRGLAAAEVWPFKSVFQGKSFVDILQGFKKIKNFGSEIFGSDRWSSSASGEHSTCGPKVRLDKAIKSIEETVEGLSLAQFFPEVRNNSSSWLYEVD